MNNVSGSFYKQLRVSKNLTQSEVSRLTGIKQSNIAKLENDYVRVLSNISLELLKFYGVDASDIEGILNSDKYKEFTLKSKCESISDELKEDIESMTCNVEVNKLNLLKAYIDILKNM